MEAGFARFLLEQIPDVYHPFGPDARAVVPSFIAVEHTLCESAARFFGARRSKGSWLVEGAWLGQRPFESKGLWQTIQL